MKTGRRTIYWDTTCWLAWLNDERTWPSDVITGIQDVVCGIEVGEILLFTSAVTRGEIFMGRLDLTQKTKFAELLRRTNVREISADPRVMDRASQIREYHNARGIKIATPDATHLATAVLYRADEMQTMDGLQQGGGRIRKLLKLSGDVGGYNLKVINPYPWRSVPPELKTIRGPLLEPALDEKPTGEDAEISKDDQHKRGLISGRGGAEDPAGAKAEKAMPPAKPKPAEEGGLAVDGS